MSNNDFMGLFKGEEVNVESDMNGNEPLDGMSLSSNDMVASSIGINTD